MRSGWLRRLDGGGLPKVNAGLLVFGIALVLVGLAGSEVAVNGIQVGRNAPSWLKVLLIGVGVLAVISALLAGKGPTRTLWASRGFFGAPPRLPARFVGRPALGEAIAGALRGQRKCVALTGIGGAGKSTAAAWVCGDRRVRQYFRDGMTWLEAGLGREPVQLLVELARRLGLLEGMPGFTTVTEGRDQIAAAIRDKRILVVLDDVWDRGPLDAVLGLAPGCVVMFTTRSPEIATTFAADRIKVDEMTREQARELLGLWSGIPADDLPSDARRLCSRVGNLALGVTMAGAMVARGRSFADVLALIERDLDHISVPLDPEYAYRTLYAAVEAGISALPADDQRRYAQLVVFARLGPFPQDAARALWHLELQPAEADDLIADLVGRSLLGSAGAGWYVAHDLQYEVLSRMLSADSLVAAHAQLLDGYRRRFPACWAESASDSYLSRALVGHLRAAGRDDEARAVLTDVSWIAGRLAEGQLPDLLSDYGDASSLLCQQVADALRLSAHALSADPGLLRGQLVGRLHDHPDPAVSDWADRLAAGDAARAWLHPLTPALIPTTTALRQVLGGRSRWVLAVAVSPDGNLAVSGGTGGSIRVWELSTGRLLAVLPGHDTAVTSLALTADAATIVSGGHDGTVRIWDLSAERKPAVLTGHSGSVSSVAVSADGSTAVSGGDDGTIRVWDVPTLLGKGTLTASRAGLRAVAISADGTLAVSGGRDGSVRLWDLTGSCQAKVLAEHKGPALSVAVDAAGTVAVSGGGDGVVRVADLTSNQQCIELGGGNGPVLAVATSADGSVVVGGGSDGTARAWDAASGQVKSALAGHDGRVLSVAVTADGTTAVSGGADGSVRVWDLQARPTTITARRDIGAVWAAAVATDANAAVTGTADGSMLVWDLSLGDQKHMLDGHGCGAPSAIAVTPDAKLAVSSTGDGSLRVWDLSSADAPFRLPGHEGWAWPSLAVTPDGTLAVSGGGDGTLRVWDLVKRAERAVLPGHAGGVQALAVSADGTSAVSGGTDGTVRTWDLIGLRQNAVLTGHTGWVSSVAISSDAKLAVSGGNDGTVRTWELTSNRQFLLPRRHNRPVLSVGISPDSTVGVSGDDAGSLHTWDIDTRTEISHWKGDYAIIACGALSGVPALIGVVECRYQPYLLSLRDSRRP